MTENTILITGAGTGIGRQTARLFLDNGWRVALVGRRQEPLEEAAQGHAKALPLPCDVTDEGSVDAAFATLVDRWGRLDVLFNNAGTNVPAKPIDELTIEEWHKVSNVNITGMFVAARAAFRQMRAQDPQGGRIINNGSISAHVPRPGSAPYTMSKHAVTGLTRTLSLDGRRFNIACGQIDIGNAFTELSQRMKSGVVQADLSFKPEPMMDAIEVAKSVHHMASLPPEANVQFMTVMASAMPYIGRG